MSKLVKFPLTVTLPLILGILSACTNANQGAASSFQNPLAQNPMQMPQNPVQSLGSSTQPAEAPGSLSDGGQIIAQKCVYCHAAQPNPNSGYPTAPRGLTFETQAAILSHLGEIKTVVLVKKSMPLDLTMSDQERTLLGQWLDQLSSTAAPRTPAAKPTPVPSKKPTALPSAAASPAPALDNTSFTSLITQKCAYCHATTPNAASGYASAPRGLHLETQQQITDNLTKVKQYVGDGSMPIGKISLTAAQKAQILAWNPDAPTTGASSMPTLPSASPAPIQVKTAPELITQKCAYCHASTPDPSSGYSKAPGGLLFGLKLDTEAEMQSNSSDISKEVGGLKMPPPGTLTLTAAERKIIVDWADQQTAGKSWWQRLF